MFSLRLSPRAFLIVCRITVATIVLNVATGAAVRLSDSGLGCPDWPTCAHSHLTPPLALHPIIEFGNRMVVTLLVVVCGITWLASLVRDPARRDLRWLSGGLVLGVLAEAVVGAIVVYSKLNAYVVMTHFMIGIALLSVGVVLALRAGCGPGRGTIVVARRVVAVTRVYLVLLTAALVAGTATTGAGPHAGGKGAKRVPIPLSDMARIHAETVLVTGVALLTLLWMLWKTDAPARIQSAGRILLGTMVIQGFIGYAQYFTHLPAVLVGIHVLGATVVWSTALWFQHGLADHRAEEMRATAHGPAEATTAGGAATGPAMVDATSAVPPVREPA